MLMATVASAIPYAANSAPALKPWRPADAAKASMTAPSTGSDPLPRHRKDDRSSGAERSRSRAATEYPKFGANDHVPPKVDTHSIQAPGDATNRCGGARTYSAPNDIALAVLATNPMSWYCGNHDTTTSSSPSRGILSAMPSRLWVRHRCGITTPFGSEVEPLVNCRMAVASWSSGGRS